jgi:hypothetical protein
MRPMAAEHVTPSASPAAFCRACGKQMAPEAAICPACGAAAPGSPAVSTIGDKASHFVESGNVYRAISICGIALMVSTFLPWASSIRSFSAWEAYSYFDIVLLFAGGGLMAAGYFQQRVAPFGWWVISGLGVLLLIAIIRRAISPAAAGFESDFEFSAGLGLWLAAFAILVASVSSALVATRRAPLREPSLWGSGRSVFLGLGALGVAAAILFLGISSPGGKDVNSEASKAYGYQVTGCVETESFDDGEVLYMCDDDLPLGERNGQFFVPSN